MSFKFIVTRQIAPEYDISTHQIQNFSGEGAQPPPPVGEGHPLRTPHPLGAFGASSSAPPPLKIPRSATDINRHKSSVIKNLCMVSCYLWVRRLDVEEIWWVTNTSFWNEGIKTDTTSLMDSKYYQWMDSGKAAVTRTLSASIKTTNLHYFGHIMRHNCI